MNERSSQSRLSTLWIAVVILLGDGLYVWLLSRAWVERDQVVLLALGERFAISGVLDPVAKGMSGGGTIPGSLLQILIGFPLMLWQDYRAPLIVIGLFNFFAGFIIYRTAQRIFEPRAAFIFFTIYWLSPWRLTDGGSLWEPSYMFLPAAIVFWSASTLASRRSFAASLALGIVLLATVQLHGSFLFLWILTALLVWKKKIHMQWLGFIIGAVVGSLTLLPMAIAFVTSSLPTPLPTDGFIGKGFVYVFPFLKGIFYWLRVPTLDKELRETMFLQPGWATTLTEHIAVVLLWMLRAIEVLTIALSIAAAWWYIRRLRTKTLLPRDLSWPEWLAWYAFLALIISAGLAPITLQDWHVVVALPFAAIPIALMATRWSKTVPRFRYYFAAYIALAVAIVLILGFGQPGFRKTVLPKEIISYPQLKVLFPPGVPIEQ